MGPPPLSGGKAERVLLVRVVLGASMGPPPSAVESTMAIPTASICSRFNGATASQRWKDWQRPIRAGISTCFNGATAPSGGKLQPECCQSRRQPCFNGATAFSRWKADYRLRLYVQAVMLQWGHRLSAVEIGQGNRHRTGHSNASMGPPPLSGGRSPCPTPTARWSTSFNGATACKRWKGELSQAQRLLLPSASMGPPPPSGGKGQD